jgi:preprotein translocase subunit SecA
MGQIREETVGYLFNLEVEVQQNPTGAVSAPVVAAKGLGGSPAPAQNLSYSAPSADNGGEVEVRNQRGQVNRAATAKARQKEAEQEQTLAPTTGRYNGGEQPTGGAPRQGGGAARPGGQRGAFGQQGGGAPAAPVNRAQRRAADKGKS